MNYAYYPGCTLIEKDKDFNEEIKHLAQIFNLNFTELPEWFCCGAVLSTSVENLMVLSSPVRNLNHAKESGFDKLVVACSACFNVLKRANEIIKKKEDVREKINLFCENNYRGETEVMHILEVLKDVGYEKIKEKVKKPLNKKVAPYYGCLLLRPKEIAIDNPENPKILHNVLEAIGAEVIDIPYKTECCGAYLQIASPSTANKLSQDIIRSSQLKGAEVIATSCPLCYFNLKNVAEDKIEIAYFSKLLWECLK